MAKITPLHGTSAPEEPASQPNLTLVAKSRNGRTPATLRYVVFRNPDVRYKVEQTGKVTLEIPSKAFWKEAKRRTLDEAASFLWRNINGIHTVSDLCNLFHTEYPGVRDPQAKVLTFLGALHRDNLISYENE